MTRKDEDVKVAVTNPHDAVFKNTFKEIRIAKDVIQKNLPQEMIQDMDFNTLKLLDGSFVSKELKETFSDVLYGVKIAGTHTYIALLLEHKSSPDKFAALQVSRYIIDLWERTLKEKQELPIVIPIIFYHGRQGWNYETDLRNYIPNYKDLPNYLKEGLPTLKHDFITMHTHDEDQMKRYYPLTRLVLRSFKYIFYDLDILIEQFLISVDDLKDHVQDDDIQRFVELMLFYYDQSNKAFTEDALIRKSRTLEGKGDAIVNILQARENKGMEKGLEEGLERGREEGLEKGMEKGIETLALEMLKDGLSLQRVARLSKLPPETLKELQKKL